MKIGIVGWGLEGQSAYRFFGPDHEYLICNEEPQSDFPAESSKVKVQYLPEKRPIGTTGNAKDFSYLAGLDTCDKVIYSPTAYHNLKQLYGDKDFWQKATTPFRIFFEEVKSKNLIGVTGTKGKGTTTTMIAKMLEAAGHKTWLGGNIGVSVLDFLSDIQPDDWVVLELSSYQLTAFPFSPHIAVCLMISPEHLDWHRDMQEYTESKGNIFRNQSMGDIAIYLDDDESAEELAGLSPGKKISFMGPDGAHLREDGMIVIGHEEKEVLLKSEVKLLGEHNLENVCAALTAFQEAAWDLDAAKQVLSSFSGLEHRLEFVRSLNEVDYYDDSFGTNPQTAIVAMKAFIQPKVMIVGGYDRGIPMDPLIDEITKQRVRHVIAIGQTGDKIAKMLIEDSYKNITTGLKTMPEIVKAARNHSEAGDVVLLSAASTSFDMFKDFKERGEQFKRAVMAL